MLYKLFITLAITVTSCTIKTNNSSTIDNDTSPNIEANYSDEFIDISIIEIQDQNFTIKRRTESSYSPRRVTAVNHKLKDILELALTNTQVYISDSTLNKKYFDVNIECKTTAKNSDSLIIHHLLPLINQEYRITSQVYPKYKIDIKDWELFNSYIVNLPKNQASSTVRTKKEGKLVVTRNNPFTGKKRKSTDKKKRVTTLSFENKPLGDILNEIAIENNFKSSYEIECSEKINYTIQIEDHESNINKLSDELGLIFNKEGEYETFLISIGK